MHPPELDKNEVQQWIELMDKRRMSSSTYFVWMILQFSLKKSYPFPETYPVDTILLTTGEQELREIDDAMVKHLANEFKDGNKFPYCQVRTYSGLHTLFVYPKGMFIKLVTGMLIMLITVNPRNVYYGNNKFILFYFSQLSRKLWTQPKKSLNWTTKKTKYVSVCIMHFQVFFYWQFFSLNMVKMIHSLLSCIFLLFRWPSISFEY